MSDREPELCRPLPRFAREAIEDAAAALRLAAALAVMYQPRLGGDLMLLSRRVAGLVPTPEKPEEP